MSIRKSACAALIGMMTAAPPLSAEPIVTSNRVDVSAVMKVTSVTTRDAYGRAERFRDAAGREFAVTYDAKLRIASIGATRGPHISDITSVRYTDEGQLAQIVFRSGYALAYGYRVDGTQTVRDSQGTTMQRLPGSRAFQPIDREGISPRLASTLADAEALIAALRAVER